MTVIGLLVGHALEDLGRAGEPFAQVLCEAVVDPSVFLLGRDGDGQDLTFGQFREGLHTESLCLDPF